MYTLYFIYMHGDKFTPRIYAITDKKELKDSFLSERNPNLFIAKKKKVTQEEKVSIMMNLNGRMLSNRGFVTKDEDGEKTEVILTVTEEEDIDTYSYSDEQVFEFINKFTNPIAEYFKDDILEALHELFYFHIMNFYDTKNPFLDGIASNRLPEIGNCKYTIDRLSAFLQLYGYTMRK